MSNMFDRTPCTHQWVDSYHGGGLSKETPDIQILVFFCKRCLAIRKKRLDASDLIISPETLELYDDDYGKGSYV